MLHEKDCFGGGAYKKVIDVEGGCSMHDWQPSFLWPPDFGMTSPVLYTGSLQLSLVSNGGIFCLVLEWL